MTTLLNKLKLFFDKLVLQIPGIERMHRLVKKAGISRPVIMTLVDYRVKMQVLCNCKKLDGTEVSVGEEYSKPIQELRRKLWESSREERRDGARVRVVYDKLNADDTSHQCNPRAGARQLSSSTFFRVE